MLAEGVSESIEKFADDMNNASKRLGMTQSNWVNPNGLPAEDQISSARDLAILARALIQEFPEYGHYWNLPGIKFGKRVMRNYNTLIGRYQGADGMKTGFICASGFNMVPRDRNGKRMIAVVLGSPSSPVRGVKTAMLFERGFKTTRLNWLTPSLGNVNTMQAINAAARSARRDVRPAPSGRRPRTSTTKRPPHQIPARHSASSCPACPRATPRPSSLLGLRRHQTGDGLCRGAEKPGETQLAMQEDQA